LTQQEQRDDLKAGRKNVKNKVNGPKEKERKLKENQLKNSRKRRQVFAMEKNQRQCGLRRLNDPYRSRT